MLSRFLSALVCTAAVVSAQTTLSTTFANNNGGAVGGAVYFDLNAAVPITITGLDLNFSSVAGTVGSVDIFVIPGSTHVGSEGTPALWSQPFGGPFAVTSAGPGQPSVVNIGAGIGPIAGLGACCIRANGLAHTYTNGAVNPTVFTQGPLTLSAGSASNVPFVGGFFTPRVVGTNISFIPAGSGTLATNTNVGVGCVRAFASFYELFAIGGNDLGNTGANLTPNGSGGYDVTPDFTPFSGPGPGAVVVPLTDDSQAAVGTLGLTVGSNGWVAFGAGNSNAFTPTAPVFLNNPSSAIYFWHDLNPAIAGSGQVFYEETSPNTAEITYNGVFDFGGTTPNFIKVIIFCPAPNFWIIIIRCGAVSLVGNQWLVGYSPGGPSNDPGSIDISANPTLSVPGADVNALALAATSRPITGTNWNLAVSNSRLLDLIILGTSDPNIPDLSLLGIPMPGCGLRASLDLISVGSTTAVGIPNNPGLIGLQLFANGASLSTENAFGFVTSNGVIGTIGDL